MKNNLSLKCCPGAKDFKVSPAHVAALKALAHPGRLRVFFHLARAGRPVTVNRIQAALKLPGPTLSHHLDGLERAGLIERHRAERFIFSAVRREMVLELVRVLTACC